LIGFSFDLPLVKWGIVEEQIKRLLMQTFLQRKIVGGLAMRKSVFTLMALTCASAAGMAQTAY
jgi:hypothetical protein